MARRHAARVTVRATSILVGLATAAATLLATATPAHADTIPPTIDGNGGIGSGNPGGTPTPGGPGDPSTGGGGGQWNPPGLPGEYVNVRWYHGTGGFDPNRGPWTGNWLVGSITCPKLGDGRAPIGWSYRWATWYPDGADNGQTVTRLVPGTSAGACEYGPQPADSQILCPIDLSAVGTGPRLNDMYASSTFLNVRRTSPFAAGGRKDPELCGQGQTLAVGRTLTKMGIWELNIDGHVATCTRRDYPGSSQAPDVVGCAPARALHAGTWYATVWCNGWASGQHADHTFNETECATTGGGGWSCGVVAPATAAGRTSSPSRPVEVFRDGRRVAVRYPRFAPAHVTGLSSLTSRVYRVSGTPVPAGNHMVSPVELAPGYFEEFRQGAPTSYALRVVKASDWGRPLEFGRQLRFEGTFPLPSTVRIDAVDWLTGAVRTSSSAASTRSSAQCENQHVVVNALRVAGVNS